MHSIDILPECGDDKCAPLWSLALMHDWRVPKVILPSEQFEITATARALRAGDGNRQAYFLNISAPYAVRRIKLFLLVMVCTALCRAPQHFACNNSCLEAVLVSRFSSTKARARKVSVYRLAPCELGKWQAMAHTQLLRRS
ncbi:hypothetical protein TRVL_08110 [Trypanosoma vivax]|nr:hypothetical protein TRVL_08110 [Trypanosoma vivax]